MVWNLLAALLMATPALALVQVDAMRGAGSPDWDVGHPRSLTQYTGCTDPALPCSPAPAVFYPSIGAPNFVANPPTCATSPMCFPNTIPTSQASPWFGTPPPSGLLTPTTARHRIVNPCSAPGGNPITGLSQVPPYFNDANHYPTNLVKPGQWTPLESVTNTQTTPLSGLAVDSIANTPFNGPPADKFHNPYSTPPDTGLGDGRYHLSNESITQAAFDRIGQPNILFTANPDPNNIEGAPDSTFTWTGHDGYALGRFELPVLDADGYDFQVNIVAVVNQPFSTFCVYGATDPLGPYTLVHSGFLDDTACDRTFKTTSYCPALQPTANCPQGDYCFSFDLGLYYKPLRELRGAADPGRMDYILVTNSMDKTPYLKNNFTVERLTDAPMTPAGLGPLRQDALFFFNDTSVRFGHPLWWKVADGAIVPDPVKTSEDPIAEWNWDFSSDPYAVHRTPAQRPPREASQPPLPPLAAPPLERRAHVQSTQAANHNVTHEYTSPGIFQACHSVHTTDQILGGSTIVWRQSDPPQSDPGWPTARWPIPPPFTHFAQADPRQVPLVANMHCKPLTVFNLAPTPLFTYSATWNDSQRIQFYDASEDTDWVMPPMPFPATPQPGTEGDYGPCVKPPEPYAYNRCNLPRGPTAYEGCCACYDCPPDGIQMRSWDFTSDGVVDATWYYRARTRNDLRFATADTVNPDAPPFVCPADPATSVPGANDSCDPFLVESGGFGFVNADCHATPGGSLNSWIYGPGIPAGATIVAVLSNRVARISSPVFADIDLGKPAGSPFVVACPYDDEIDSPATTYPRPGEYNATLRVCDHDWVVRMSPVTPTTSRIWGAQAWPNPATKQWSLEGDPFGAATGVAPNPSPFTTLANATIGPGTALSGVFHNLHACQALRQPVRIPNMVPHISVPPTLVVRPNMDVTFTVVATDTDRGQSLTIRPCVGQAMLDGMSFGPVTAAGQGVEHTVSFNVGAISLGQYGPYCFEVCDSYGACAHAVMSLWISGETTDTDADGIRDLADNCPSVPNHDQADANGDGVGDACQILKTSFAATPPALATLDTVDHDGDAVPDLADNCPSVPNHFQEDMEGDGVGDVCDMDTDGDGVVDTGDNCPTVPNPLQEDPNRDGLGEACATLGAARGLLDRPKGGLVQPEAVASPTPGLLLGSVLGLLAMMAILVPLLLFALRRHGQAKDAKDEE